MSKKYDYLPYTKFPDELDVFSYSKDMPSDAALLNTVAQYQKLYASGDFSAAAIFLQAHGEIEPYLLTASKMNQIKDALMAIEKFYFDDIEEYLVNLISFKGAYNASTTYHKYDVVTYDGRAYMAIVPSDFKSKVPTNQSYWIPLTIKGEQGIPGLGLHFEGEWVSGRGYQKNACVVYKNSLWASLIEGNTYEPGTNSSAWQEVITGINHTGVVFAALPAGRSRGDVNGDGFIDEIDALLVHRHVNNTARITNQTQLNAADVNGDGKVDISDSQELLNIVTGTQGLVSNLKDLNGKWNVSNSPKGYYYDILIDGVNSSTSAVISVGDGLSAENILKAESMSGCIRLYTKVCPTVSVEVGIILSNAGNGQVFINAKNSERNLSNKVSMTLPKAFLLGDLDHDGIITNIDALLVYQHLNEDTDFTLDQALLTVADVNQDGVVNMDDAQMLMESSQAVVVSKVSDTLRNWNIEQINGVEKYCHTLMINGISELSNVSITFKTGCRPSDFDSIVVLDGGIKFIADVAPNIDSELDIEWTAPTMNSQVGLVTYIISESLVPKIEYGQHDLVANETKLATGSFYFVYE